LGLELVLGEVVLLLEEVALDTVLLEELKVPFCSEPLVGLVGRNKGVDGLAMSSAQPRGRAVSQWQLHPHQKGRDGRRETGRRIGLN